MLNHFPSSQLKYQGGFFKHTKDFNMLDGTVNLATLEQWLKKEFQIVFNPIANIAAEIKKQKTK